MWSLSDWFDEMMVDGNENGNEAQNNACKDLGRRVSCQLGQHRGTLLVFSMCTHTLAPGMLVGSSMLTILD